MGDDMYAGICERLERIERLAALGAKLVLNTDEAAEFLGLSKSRMHHLTSARLIPHYRQGGRLYFRKAELEAWLTAHRVMTETEVDAEAEKLAGRIRSDGVKGGRKKREKPTESINNNKRKGIQK